jgi:hypothetical protein
LAAEHVVLLERLEILTLAGKRHDRRPGWRRDDARIQCKGYAWREQDNDAIHKTLPRDDRWRRHPSYTNVAARVASKYAAPKPGAAPPTLFPIVKIR